MKKIYAVILAILSIAWTLCASAQMASTNVAVGDGGGGGVRQTPVVVITNTAAASDWSYSAGTIIMSRYYGTIFGGVFYDGPMSFTDVGISYKNSLGRLTYVAMAGQKLDRLGTYNHDGGNEYDTGLDQSFRLGSKAYPVLVDVGMMYLFTHDLSTTKGDAFDETIRVDFPIRADLASGPIIQPYFQEYHYHVVGNEMKDAGWIGYAGLIRDQSISPTLKLNFDYRMGINSGVYESHSGIEFHRLAVSLPIPVGRWTLTPSLIGQLHGGDHQTYVTNDSLFYTLSLRRSF